MVTRRQANGNSSESPEEAAPEAPFTSESEVLTHYSSQSEILQPGRLAADIVRNIADGRELAWRLFVRNIRGLYRQTLLGLFWAILPPIANTAFWLVLKNVNVVNWELPVHPVVFLMTSMILWQAFIDAFQMPLNMLAKNRNMISKLNFPRESLLMVGMGEVLFDLTIRMFLLAPLFVIYGVSFKMSMVLAPLVLVSMVLLGAGMGLWLLPIGSLYQDVGRFIGVAIPFWMVVTPVPYPPLSGYPALLLNWLNPASPLLIVARDFLLLGGTSHGLAGWIFAVLSIVIFCSGLIVYRVSVPVLVERMNA